MKRSILRWSGMSVQSTINGVVLLCILGSLASAANASKPLAGVDEQPQENGSPVLPGTYERIVKFAAERVNKSRVGDGKSASLVLAAFKDAALNYPNDVLIYSKLDDRNNLVWGDPVSRTKLRPGFIIQFYNCRFEGEGKATQLPLRHTAIVEKTDGNRVTLLEQGYVTKKKKKNSYVRRQELDLTWNLVKADKKDSQKPRYVIFQPIVLQ